MGLSAIRKRVIGEVMYPATAHLPIEKQLLMAVRLFTHLRWLPPPVIVAGGFVLKYLFGFNLNMWALSQIALWIVAYNAYLMWRYNREQPRTVNDLLRCANLHMFFDYFTITVLVYFTGGLLSPLIWFYSTHIIVSCIFFHRRKAAWTTFLLWSCLATLLFLEHFGVLAHQPVYALLAPGAEGVATTRGLLFAVLSGTAVLWTAIIWLVSMIIARVRLAEHEERELQDKFRDTLLELRKLQQQRDLYRRSMTHDMRSPIAAGQSLLRVMLTGAFGPIGDKQRDALQRTGKRLDQMMQMIQDILDIERSSQLQFVLEPIPLAPLVERLLEVQRPQLEERDIALELDLDTAAVALADRDDAEAIVGNLISNAVKYNRDGGRLRIVVTAGHGVTSVQVTDTGIGISAADQEKLFTEFFRAGNAKQHTVDGTGLGLAIVKKLVEQNRGALHLQSELGQGSSFTVILPEARADAAPELPRDRTV
jgi:signal transduction histidine kinase